MTKDQIYGQPGANVGLVYRGVPASRLNGDLVLLQPGRAIVRFCPEGEEAQEAVFDLTTGQVAGPYTARWALVEESRARLLALAPLPVQPPPSEPKRWKKVSPGRRKR